MPRSSPFGAVFPPFRPYAAFRWSTVTLLVLFVVSCGGDAPPELHGGPSEATAAVAPLDACALLSAEEAQALLEEPVGEPRRGVDHAGDDTSASVSRCTWETVDQGRWVSLFVRRAPVADLTDEAVAAVREVAAMNGEPRDVDGLGDAAFFGPEGDGVSLYVFWRGNHHAIVEVHGYPDSEGSEERARTVAERVIQRL